MDITHNSIEKILRCHDHKGGHIRVIKGRIQVSFANPLSLLTRCSWCRCLHCRDILSPAEHFEGPPRPFFWLPVSMSGKLGLSEEEVEHLKVESAEWCRYNGLVMREGQTASMTLTPGRQAYLLKLLTCSVPKHCVEKAKTLAPLFNKLVHKISEDVEFLLDVHRSVPDDFTQRLVRIVKTVHEEGRLCRRIITDAQVATHKKSRWVFSAQITCYTIPTTERRFQISRISLTLRKLNYNKLRLTQSPPPLQACHFSLTTYTSASAKISRINFKGIL